MAQAPAVQVQDFWVDDLFVLFPGVDQCNRSFPLLSCSFDSWDGSHPDSQSSTQLMVQWSSLRNVQQSVSAFRSFVPFVPFVEVYALHLQATRLSISLYSVSLSLLSKTVPARLDLRDTHTELCPHHASITSLPGIPAWIPAYHIPMNP